MKLNTNSHAYGMQQAVPKDVMERAIKMADSILAEFDEEDLYVYAWDRMVSEMVIHQFTEWEDV